MMGLLENPMFNLGLGVLSSIRPGGSVGGGLLTGMQNMQAMQQGAAQRSLLEERAEEMRQQREQRERQRQMFDQMMGSRGEFTNIAPGSPEEFAAFDQPNYAGNVTGGVRMDEAPSGLLGNNPQMAQVMGLLGPEQGSQFLANSMLQQMQPSDDSKAIEIQRLQENLGVDLPTATGIAYGTLKTTQPDAQGNVGIIDIGNQRLVGSYNIAQRPTQPPSEPSGMPPNSYLMEAAEQGTGPGAAVKSGINNLIGWAVEGIPFENEAKARQNLREFNQFVIQSLVNNPRAPVAEQKNIRAFQPDPDKFFKDPDEARAQIQSLFQFLEQKKRAYQSSLQNQDLPLDERSKLQSQLAGVDRVLEMMSRQTPEDPKKSLSEKYGVELD